MKKILAIGGAVIKTARQQFFSIIQKDEVEMLIHNGGSIFHDFQLALEDLGGKHSHSIEEISKNILINKRVSMRIWRYFDLKDPPPGSITRLCQSKEIPVLMFTGLGCDYWQMFGLQWDKIGSKCRHDFTKLSYRMVKPFHYLCMGSAVIHPEVFTKALAMVLVTVKFQADVVDFLSMYRPRTRIAQYGNYYCMSHREFLDKWLSKGYPS